MSRRSDTTQQIVRSAAELFYLHGFGKVSVDTIAAHAGITKVTVYQHFRSKEALLVDCMNWRLMIREATLDSRFCSRPISPSAVLEIFDWSESWLSSSNFRGCAFTKTVNEMSESLPEVRRIAQRAKQMLRERISRIAEAGGLTNAAELGDELATVLEGAQVLSLIEQDARPFRSARNVAMKLLAFHGCNTLA